MNKFCPICGERIWKNLHTCKDTENITIASLSYVSNMLLDALINAEELILGTHSDPERAKARIRRTLWKFQLSDDERLFYMLPTSTEELEPTEW